MIREPSRVWKSLHRIKCPALIVKIAKSPLLDREASQKKWSRSLRNGRLAEIDDSYHHVMLDNPQRADRNNPGFCQTVSK